MVLLAILGLVLCLVGIAGAWLIKSRVDAVGAAVFGTTDKAFEFVEGKLNLVKQGLERNRQSAGDLSRIAGRLKNAEADVRRESESLLQVMDAAYQEFQSAESWLESAHALANGVSRVSDTLVSSEFAASRQESAGVAVAREVREFANSVTEALSQLQSMRGELINLRNAGVLAREAVLVILGRVAALEQAVDRLDVRLGNVISKVEAARITCAEQGRRFRRWTLAAALAASILPVWFGFSQIVVMAYGWRRAHPVSRSA